MKEVLKMSWLKEKNVTFRLSNLDVVEEFVIWKAWNLNEEILGEDGQPLKFPIKTGSIKGEDGSIRDVQTEMKFMKRDDFQKAYPKMSKATTYIRQIYDLKGGQECTYRFKKSANDKLNDLINTITSMGKNVLDVSFQQTFDKSKQAAQMYDIKIVNQGDNAPNPQVPNNQVENAQGNPLPPSNVTPLPVQSQPAQKPAVKLTDTETEVLNAIKSLGANVDKTRFIQIAKANGVSLERAEIMFEFIYK